MPEGAYLPGVFRMSLSKEATSELRDEEKEAFRQSYEGTVSPKRRSSKEKTLKGINLPCAKRRKIEGILKV